MHKPLTTILILDKKLDQYCDRISNATNLEKNIH